MLWDVTKDGIQTNRTSLTKLGVDDGSVAFDGNNLVITDKDGVRSAFQITELRRKPNVDPSTVDLYAVRKTGNEIAGQPILTSVGSFDVAAAVKNTKNLLK